MKKNPKITIITVCYNSEKTIERTIKSVIQQTYPSIEYIIIDGNSTDTTVQIIKKYEQWISAWVSEPDDGIYDAMNKGIRMASGELIAFINSDDWYAGNVMDAVADTYIKSNADVLYGDIIYIDKNDEEWKYHYQSVLLEEFYYRMPLSHQAVFVKTALQKQYGFDTNYLIASDYKFLSTLCHMGKKFQYMDKLIAVVPYGGYSTKLYHYKTVRETREIATTLLKQYLLPSDRERFEHYAQKADEHYRKAVKIMARDRMLHYEFPLRWLKAHIGNGRTVMLFGAGQDGKACYTHLHEYGISVDYFVDNSPKLEGKKLFGIPILLPCILHEYKKVNLIISSIKYESELCQQLFSMHLDPSINVFLYSLFKPMIYRDYFRVLSHELILGK